MKITVPVYTNINLNLQYLSNKICYNKKNNHCYQTIDNLLFVYVI